MADPIIDLETLIAELPDELKPWAREFAPWLGSLALVDGIAWLNRVAAGDIEGAYRVVCSKMSNAEFAASRDKLLAEGRELTAENARRMAIFKTAGEAIVWALLKIVLIMVSL